MFASELPNKKITFFYIFIFIFLFSILSLINYIFRTKIVGFSIGHTYDITGKQISSYKYNSHDKLLNFLFNKKYKIKHQIKDLSQDNDSNFILNNNLSFFRLKLLLPEYIDEKKLEEELNKLYIEKIIENKNKLEKYKNLYDYRILNKNFDLLINDEINKKYYSLINSNLFKNYPPNINSNCNKNKKIKECLVEYINFYLFILDLSKNSENYQTLSKIFNNNFSITDFTKEFTKNINLLNSDSIKNLTESNLENKKKFFIEQFYILNKSEIFLTFIANNQSICKILSLDCFEETSRYLDNLSFIHSEEAKNLFKVKYNLPIEKSDFFYLSESIKIFAFSILITYILFIFTNKFLREKLR